MKTAISIPDDVFQAGERLAGQLGLTRSGLYVTAIREYLERHDDEEITRRLNQVYEREAAVIDPAITLIAASALPKESWK